MAKKPAAKKSVATLTHSTDKRKNIPTAEFQPMVKDEQQHPIRVANERRNRDLDPQLVWRKDEQDWSDLVVHAPPLYIQDKVHPKVLIDDLLKQTQEQEQQGKFVSFDLFADFNGIPLGVDKTDFYQHDQNWSNRMILGDSLQVMASLAEREGLRGKVHRRTCCRYCHGKDFRYQRTAGEMEQVGRSLRNKPRELNPRWRRSIRWAAKATTVARRRTPIARNVSAKACLSLSPRIRAFCRKARAGCPCPMVKARFHWLQPSSKVRCKRVAVSLRWTPWIAVMVCSLVSGFVKQLELIRQRSALS